MRALIIKIKSLFGLGLIFCSSMFRTKFAGRLISPIQWYIQNIAITITLGNVGRWYFSMSYCKVTNNSVPNQLNVTYKKYLETHSTRMEFQRKADTRVLGGWNNQTKDALPRQAHENSVSTAFWVVGVIMFRFTNMI